MAYFVRMGLKISDLFCELLGVLDLTCHPFKLSSIVNIIGELRGNLPQIGHLLVLEYLLAVAIDNENAIERRVDLSFKERRFPKQLFLDFLATCNITDVALYQLFLCDQVGVTDEFNLDTFSLFRFQGQTFISDSIFTLQFRKSQFRSRFSLEWTNLPELSA